MSLTIEALGPEEMATGFALAGIPAVEVRDTDEGLARLGEMLARDDLAVILADDSIVAAMPLELRRRMDRTPLPVVVPVPRPHFEDAGEDVATYLLDLLQRAIGYRMRLK